MAHWKQWRRRSGERAGATGAHRDTRQIRAEDFSELDRRARQWRRQREGWPFAMIKLRRAGQRHRLHSGGQTLWLTFYPAADEDPLANGFGALTTLNEGRLEPESNLLPYSRRGTEMVSYVIEGTMSHRDGSGSASLIRAGDFQCSSVPHSDHVSYTNASGRDPLHVLQLSLSNQQSRRSRIPQQKSFPTRERTGAICLVGSEDGRQGSLILDQDVLLYSCLLHAGQRVVHSLAEDRIVWIHVVRGEVSLGDTSLAPGDGAGICLTRAVSLSALSDAEVVLLDLAMNEAYLPSELDGREREARAASRQCLAAAGTAPNKIMFRRERRLAISP